MNAMRSPTLSQWIASNACDIKYSKFQHRSTVIHNVMNLSYVQYMCIVESFKLKRYGYMGLALARPIDVQTSSQDYSCPSIRPSVAEGQRKRFDLETPAAVSRAVEHRKVELGDLCERQSWY